jgi:Short C-terminal domain
MRRTVLIRLIALLVAIAAVIVVGVVAYNFGVNNSGNGNVLGPRGPFRGEMMVGWGAWGPGFGLFGLVCFVLIGLLFFWLLAALLSPDGGGRRSVGPASGDTERLRELSDLHTAGKLTDEEFAAAKRKLLGLP